jgi:hypothetical protein
MISYGSLNREDPTPLRDERIQVRDIRTLPFLWIHRTLLATTKPSSNAILTYLALAYYAAASSDCTGVGIRQLAEIVGTSENSIRRGLKELTRKRAIIVRERYKTLRGRRRQMPNDYVLIDLAERNQPI